MREMFQKIIIDTIDRFIGHYKGYRVSIEGYDHPMYDINIDFYDGVRHVKQLYNDTLELARIEDAIAIAIEKLKEEQE